MIILSKALHEWQTPLFADAFQSEIQQLNVDQLLLQQALQHGSHATTDNMKLMMLSVVDDAMHIKAKVGVFYNSTITGCQCDDDPSPMNVEIEYCELLFTINKKTAETLVTLIS